MRAKQPIGHDETAGHVVFIGDMPHQFRQQRAPMMAMTIKADAFFGPRLQAEDTEGKDRRNMMDIKK